MTPDDASELSRLVEENAHLRKQLAAIWSDSNGDLDMFKIIFQTIPDGVVTTHASDGKIISVNRGFERLLGHRSEELVGKSTIELGIWVRPEDRSRFLADLERSGTVNDFVTQFRRKDGSVFSGLISAAYFKRNNDEYILGVNKNIDPISSLSRELNAGRTRYMDLVELLPAVLFECDAELSITFMNAAGLRLFGGPMEAGKRIPLSRIVGTPQELDLVEWAAKAKGSSRHARVEVEARRKDGYTYPALLIISSIRIQSGEDGYLGVLVDVTDQRLSQSQVTRLSQAVEQSPSLVLITDKSGHIEYVNPSFSRLTGFGVEEVIGRTPRILKSGAVHEETYRTMWNTILAGREWKTEILNRKKNGETYWQRSTISPIYDEKGEISHFLEVAEDITREKELESELFQSQKMEAIGHLAGGIAHDFNNMLTVIMGVGELLSERLTESAELKGYAESILSAARKSASLTHQLLAFSRKQLLRPEKLDVNVIIRDAEKLLHRIVRDNIRIRTSFAEDLGFALLDQSQLHQIILNLTVNAKEAIIGSGTISISTRPFQTDHELIVSSGKLSPGSYVTLSIRDTGNGMDPETLSHIFEPFFTTKTSGTGLGLATVYGIVQQSEGQIDVESTPGKGSRFTLYFPRISREGIEERKGTKPASMGAGSETILVVEDDEAVRTFVSEVLENNGYTIFPAESAERARELWRTIGSRVELVLTDVVLPQEDGVHLYRALRDERLDLPVVYMTGYTEDSSSILDEIADGRILLPKPFGAEQLTAAVRRILDARPGT